MSNQELIKESIRKHVKQLHTKYLTGALDRYDFSKKIDELTIYSLRIDKKGCVINETI